MHLCSFLVLVTEVTLLFLSANIHECFVPFLRISQYAIQLFKCKSSTTSINSFLYALLDVWLSFP